MGNNTKKVKLMPSGMYKDYTFQKGRSVKGISHSLPFYKSKSGKYFHRVRSAQNHWENGDLSHTAIHFWCGNSGFMHGKGRLYSEIPEDGILCATCEGRVIGAGMDGSREINGRQVMYSPRKE